MAAKPSKPPELPPTPGAPAAKKTPRYVKNVIDLGAEKVAIYATPKISHALDAVTEDMTLFQGVKLTVVMKAVYDQGVKDGAQSAFTAVSGKLREAEKAVPHRNPGKPKAPPKTVAPAKKMPTKPKK